MPLWIQTLLCTVASPVYFDFEQKRAIPGRHHYCPIQDHIRSKKAPLQLNIDSNGLVFKHSTVNLIHEKKHFFHWTFHIVYLHSQRWAFCNSFLAWEFMWMPSLQWPLFAIELGDVRSSSKPFCAFIYSNPSVHSFTPWYSFCYFFLNYIVSFPVTSNYSNVSNVVRSQSSPVASFTLWYFLSFPS